MSTRNATGIVATRAPVAGFLLDLAGYAVDQDLPSRRLLEPGCGDGAILGLAAERLVQAWRRRAGDGRAWPDLAPCLTGVERDEDSVRRCRQLLAAGMVRQGVTTEDAGRLADHWVRPGDFLLQPLTDRFDVVVSNPPYVRLEDLPRERRDEYRRRWRTLVDRADLYVAFLERSLELLAPDGRLSVICPDRWMRNRYGRRLREVVAQDHHLAACVLDVDDQAFQAPVVAYPAILLLQRGDGVVTQVARRPSLTPAGLTGLASALNGGPSPPVDSPRHSLRHVVRGDAPWLLDAPGLLQRIRALEMLLPLLEEAGCKVGIGIATGLDRAFVGPLDQLPVEPDRKVPLALATDVREDGLHWSGHGMVQPFTADGALVDLVEHPRLAAWCAQHEPALRRRHIARKRPSQWYRTIDRIDPRLQGTPKLLLPDIRGRLVAVRDDGHFLPHHNLYWITSREWDLAALRVVLESAVAEEFLAAYAPQVRGGYRRHQAQYLRRIRLPHWSDVPPDLRRRLTELEHAPRETREPWVRRAFGIGPA